MVDNSMDITKAKKIVVAIARKIFAFGTRKTNQHQIK
jgi:hypothetical protein